MTLKQAVASAFEPSAVEPDDAIYVCSSCGRNFTADTVGCRRSSKKNNCGCIPMPSMQEQIIAADSLDR